MLIQPARVADDSSGGTLPRVSARAEEWLDDGVNTGGQSRSCSSSAMILNGRGEGGGCTVQHTQKERTHRGIAMRCALNYVAPDDDEPDGPEAPAQAGAAT